MDLHKLQQHPLCARMNEKYPLKRVGKDAHTSGTDEWGALQSSVAQFGPRRRVVIDADTGQVLDGWNFLQAYLQAQDVQKGALGPIDQLVEVREFTSDHDKMRFVLAVQLGRRNLEVGQRALLATKLAQLEGGAHGAL